MEETEGSGKWYVELLYLCIVKVAEDPKRLTQNKHLLTTKKQRKRYAEIPEREAPRNRQSTEMDWGHHHPHREHVLHPELHNELRMKNEE